MASETPTPASGEMPESQGDSKGESKGETFSRPLDVPEVVRDVMRYARASKEDNCRAAVWLYDENARLTRELSEARARAEQGERDLDALRTAARPLARFAFALATWNDHNFTHEDRRRWRQRTEACAQAVALLLPDEDPPVRTSPTSAGPRQEDR